MGPGVVGDTHLGGRSIWRSLGHVSRTTGATGTVAWADPELSLSCVCLTNNNVAEGSLLRRVSNAVVAAVEE